MLCRAQVLRGPQVWCGAGRVQHVQLCGPEHVGCKTPAPHSHTVQSMTQATPHQHQRWQDAAGSTMRTGSRACNLVESPQSAGCARCRRTAPGRSARATSMVKLEQLRGDIRKRQSAEHGVHVGHRPNLQRDCKTIVTAGMGCASGRATGDAAAAAMVHAWVRAGAVVWQAAPAEALDPVHHFCLPAGRGLGCTPAA